MYLLIILLPIIASVLTGLFGRFLGFRGAALITTSCVFLSALGSIVAFCEVAVSGIPCTIEIAQGIPETATSQKATMLPSVK